jgi:hypothetical protein
VEGMTENLVRWFDGVSKGYKLNINKAQYHSATLFDRRQNGCDVNTADLQHCHGPATGYLSNSNA